MHNFKKLDVWNDAKNFCILIFKTTKSFPKEEKYGLTAQINRASLSIPSNIAEGCGRNSNKDFSRFINIAAGSAYEIETQLIIAFEIGYLNKKIYDALIKELNMIHKKLFNLNNFLKKKEK